MTSLWYLLYSIFIILFNAAYFMAGGMEHKASEWISYGFIHFSYAMLLLTPRMTRQSKSAYILGLTLLSVSSVYFLLELLVGSVFLVIKSDGYNVALLVQLCLAGLYGCVLIVNKIANEYTAQSVGVQQSQIGFIKAVSTSLEGFLDDVKDKEVKRIVEVAYDELRSSPVQSHPTLVEIEERIMMSMSDLENAVKEREDGKMVSSANLLLTTVKERTRQARLNN